MVHPSRIFMLNNGRPGRGAVIYWMQRDQRVNDNWALCHAMDLARSENLKLIVAFCLHPGFPGATYRHYDFMLHGLEEVEKMLGYLRIPFLLLEGEPGRILPSIAEELDAAWMVTDFNPVRIAMQWRTRVAEALRIPLIEVDAHNILPTRAISDKMEYGAFTLRKKIERRLKEFLTPFPSLNWSAVNGEVSDFEKVDWQRVRKQLTIDRSVGPVDGPEPGEEAAGKHLGHFIRYGLDQYATLRNFPDRDGQSGLSPYLHFGHISAQRVALEVQKSGANPASVQAFLEELIVRRELADNFCLYCPEYDSFQGFPPWARATLNLHRDDPRQYLCSFSQFEEGSTHDTLWNAAQREMIRTGRMHGYMRMYWAKKILEWTASPEIAIETAICLNDKYELDGRDPNGYAGVAWAIGGVHDRPWGERPVFGMIRYMNEKGCRRKFDVDTYIRNQAPSLF